MIKIVRSQDDRAILHGWRTGDEYEDQKGPVFLRECTNIKFVRLPYAKAGPVNHLRIGRPLPLPDAAFDVAYFYHVLEHHTPEEARRLLAEVYRILRPKGTFRISTPDLETTCRKYLGQLERTLQQPSDANILNYRWAVLNLIDQKVRMKPGGAMLPMMRAGQFDPEFLRDHFGDALGHTRIGDGRNSIVTRLRRRSIMNLPYALLRRLIVTATRRDPRVTGESDLMVTDRFSLHELLEDAGFIECRQMSFDRSDISGWDRLDFDLSNYGHYPLEAGSLYMEARKLAAAPGQTTRLVTPRTGEPVPMDSRKTNQ